MNAPDYSGSIAQTAGGTSAMAHDIPVGVMLRAAGGEWEFVETPKPQLRYDHKSGRPLLILGRVEGTLSKP